MGILRQAPARSVRRRRPLVGIITNCLHGFGRDILQGAMHYANLQREWLLYKDMEMVLSAQADWPPLDAAICAGVPFSVVEAMIGRCQGRVVLCSGSGDPATCPVVAVDDQAVGRAAAAHLMECRLDWFGFYGMQQGYTVAEARLAGFRAVLAEAGHDVSICPTGQTTSHQRASHEHRPNVIAWLQQQPKPFGVLAFDDTHAHDLAEACLEADIDVPSQVAIVGVNNDHLLCDSAWPPLSSVDAEYTRIGYAAARIIERLLARETLSPQERHVLLPPQGVVQRQSTSTLAIDDPNVAAAVRFIREHACDPCSVDDVLHAVPVGRRWLERQFASRLGRSPHEEIHRVRIESAERLLRKSDFTIYDIASRCGFSDLRSFYRSFSHTAGTTPAAFRRAAKVDPMT